MNIKNEQNEEKKTYFKINNILSSKKDENLSSISYTKYMLKYILTLIFILLLLFLVIFFGLNQITLFQF